MRMVFLAGMAAALLLGGCGKTATLLMNGNLPVGSRTSEKVQFDGGEFWYTLRPYQNAFSGNVYGGEASYHVRNTDSQDVCVAVNFLEDQRGQGGNAYGLSPITVLVPRRTTVIVATVQANQDSSSGAIFLYNPGFSVGRRAGPVNGAC
jgi:hypothetical protein